MYKLLVCLRLVVLFDFSSFNIFLSVDFIVQIDTFLWNAVIDGDAEMVGMLINAKADVDKRNNNVGAYIQEVVCSFYARCI